ncbi:unnamed protein product [Vitrella brassicaformis CCMP3155]|uniref:Tyrosine specific protein phosphatases domain-containing protein n=2 Tax=Vitrella brassicaformis TaxID=1169539 RepID=A0A0G4EBZ2_VITBC|nr:unnamed protein product [Vitrella brassicaformis CCMP3155]|eukprot:CEL93191.1 unnamed protein product [Vitrella brassicaformis CCMP3155]
MITGWLRYTKVGTPIRLLRMQGEGRDGAFMVPHKVPLKKTFDQAIPAYDDRFYPADLIKHMASSVAPLSAIIDLCDTKRYYDACTFEDSGVKHHKMAVKGRETPSRGDTEAFCVMVDSIRRDWTASNSPSPCVIAIHCTHGVNRTGYFVVSYLCLRCNMTLDNALSTFEQHRGHPIHRDYLLEGLRANFSTRLMPPIAPAPFCYGLSQSTADSTAASQPQPASSGTAAAGSGAAPTPSSNYAGGVSIKKKKSRKRGSSNKTEDSAVAAAAAAAAVDGGEEEKALVEVGFGAGE